MRWGNQGSGGRNVILSDRARLSVGTVNPNDASPIAGDSGLVLNSDTMSARTLVFDGNMDIAQSEDAGGNLLEQSGFSINLRSNAENIIPTGGFCYCPSLGGAGTPCQIACDTTP